MFFHNSAFGRTGDDGPDPSRVRHACGVGVSDRELAELVEKLDGHDHNAAEEAEWALKEQGSRPLDLLLERAPSFDRFGKLCAIELFDHIADPRAAGVLIPMLQDADETVREWAATTLAGLRVAEAAEPLVAAYEAVKARGTPLDWTEASGIRWALTELGRRIPVVPSFVAERAQQVDPIGQAWPVDDLVEVIEELASAQQLITSVSAYTRNAGSYGWHVDVDVEWPQLDVRVPWPQLVAAARDAALDVATHPRVPDDAYAIIAWIDRSDT